MSNQSSSFYLFREERDIVVTSVLEESTMRGKGGRETRKPPSLSRTICTSPMNDTFEGEKVSLEGCLGIG